MPLNESKGNMYKFVTHTWNTVKGKCPHGCAYCYMKRWGKQSPIHFDENELNTDLGSGNFIFVGSSCDLFASPSAWIMKTLYHCRKYPDNKYLFQSKNPAGFVSFRTALHSMSSVLCTTIETNRWYPEFMGSAMVPKQRATEMTKLSSFDRYVTIEPIMDFDLEFLVNLVWMCSPLQVNIGANTMQKVKLPEPSRDKILKLDHKLSEFTTVNRKANLKRLLV